MCSDGSERIAEVHALLRSRSVSLVHSRPDDDPRAEETKRFAATSHMRPCRGIRQMKTRGARKSRDQSVTNIPTHVLIRAVLCWRSNAMTSTFTRIALLGGEDSNPQ